MFSYSDLRAYFGDLFAQSRAKNPRLSQAAFARYLSCSASAWSNFLEGRRSLSEAKVAEIGAKLRWRPEELSHALHLRWIGDLDEKDARAESTRALARGRARTAHRKSVEVSDAGFDLDFISVVLKESVQIPAYAKDPTRAAQKLGLDAKTAERALARLVSSGTLIRDTDGTYRPAPAAPSVYVAPDRSRLLRDYYRRSLAETARRIRPETTSRRYLGSETFAFDLALLPEAKAVIDRCLDDLTALSYRSERRSSVFHAGVQLVEILDSDA